MLSVLIEVGEEPGPLAASLLSLVPGAVEGMVRDVVVLDRGLGEEARAVAEEAGCRIAEGESMAGTISAARGEWLLLLCVGARLSPGWIEAVGNHFSFGHGAGPRPARFSRSWEGRGLSRFLDPFAWWSPPLSCGLILSKGQALSKAGNARSLADLAKGVASVRLDAAIRPYAAQP
ncbi:glycosyl transferase family 2 [Consotaella aegiceratis]|uniref:glycosyl transferase family 2 n=1 Tax=Consotaella aegiceratis TaxID=3097961 RepID=UPI002F415433